MCQQGHSRCSSCQLPRHHAAAAASQGTVYWGGEMAVKARSAFEVTGSSCDTERKVFRGNKSITADSTAAAERLAAALAQAAALPEGLMLRSLKTFSLPVLKAASCSTLTCLDLHLYEDMLFPSTQEATACITGLSSQLRTLKLHAAWPLFDSTGDSAWWFEGVRTYEPGCGLHSLLSQALPQLTELTCLEVEEVPDVCIFKHAPPQLQQLELVGVDDQSKLAFDLSHMTACSWLTLERNPEYNQEGWRVVGANDILPPNLRSLFVTDCTSATPLLRLTQLMQLSIGKHCHMPVSELQRLSEMTQLESVWLGYDQCDESTDHGERAAEEGSPGWLSVPAFEVLELRRMQIDPDCVLLKHLAGLTSLTKLVWDSTQFCPNYEAAFGEYVTVYRDGGLGALSASLPTSLRRLEFASFIPYEVCLSVDDDDGRAYEPHVIMSLRALIDAIASLPHLESCIFGYPGDALQEFFSEAGAKLVKLLLSVDVTEPEPDEAWDLFCETYPDYFSDIEDDSDIGSEEGSEPEGSGEGAPDVWGPDEEGAAA